jgi:hypothetical protein
MDRPNGVHNDERTFLDRITQLESILKNRCAPPEKKPQKRGFLTRSDRLPLLGSRRHSSAKVRFKPRKINL